MAVPDFQSLMLPLLKLINSRDSVTPATAHGSLAAELHLSDADLAQRLPSGQMTVFVNRIGWARTYLKKAGLLHTPRRGVWQITEAGRSVLAQDPSRIDIRFLRQFPTFLEFDRAVGEVREDPGNEAVATPAERTPQEELERAFQVIHDSLAHDLKERLADCTPAFFEQLVVDVLMRMGYGGFRPDSGRTVGGPGDGGIDGIINEDRLGLDTIYVQAKRWEGTVGRPEIQKFAGALQGHRASKGVFIATSAFTKEAEDYVSRINSRIVLIDGSTLAKLMIEHDVGVSTVRSFAVKRVDSDYFTDE